MNAQVIKVYTALILAIPILAGAFLITHPLGISNGTGEDALKVMAYHLSIASLAVGIGMLAAYIAKSAPAIGFLLIVRGLMDAGDGITGLITQSAPAGMELFFIVLGILSLFAGRYFLRQTSWPS